MFLFPKRCHTKPEQGSVKGVKAKISLLGRKFGKINFHRVDQKSVYVDDLTQLTTHWKYTNNLYLTNKNQPITLTGKWLSKNITFQSFMPPSAFALPSVSILFIV